jgi:hypothetical protein
MGLVIRSLTDPSAQDIDLLDGQGLTQFGRRHARFWIRACNPPDQLALVGLSRQNCIGTIALVHRYITYIQAEPSLARLFVRTVAGKALGGKYRADVSIKIDKIRARTSDRVDVHLENDDAKQNDLSE